MKEITTAQLDKSCFELIGKDWMLITSAKPNGQANTMTASWGGMGIMWGKEVAFVFIRPQRYTKEFVDQSGKMSLCFFGEEYRQMLAYMGKVSGRDEDKIAKCNLNVEYADGIPYFNQARLVVTGKVLYQQRLQQDCFVDDKMVDKWYANKDFHEMYVVEIDKILKA